MGPDHGADLGGEDRVVAEDRPAGLDQSRGVLGILDVLDDPGVRRRLVALAGIVDEPLEGPAPSAHPLDGGYLLLECEDRLDLQGRADPGAGRTDPPTSSEVLERVDGEPDLEL